MFTNGVSDLVHNAFACLRVMGDDDGVKKRSKPNVITCCSICVFCVTAAAMRLGSHSIGGGMCPWPVERSGGSLRPFGTSPPRGRPSYRFPTTIIPVYDFYTQSSSLDLVSGW